MIGLDRLNRIDLCRGHQLQSLSRKKERKGFRHLLRHYPFFSTYYLLHTAYLHAPSYSTRHNHNHHHTVPSILFPCFCLFSTTNTLLSNFFASFVCTFLLSFKSQRPSSCPFLRTLQQPAILHSFLDLPPNEGYSFTQ